MYSPFANGAQRASSHRTSRHRIALILSGALVALITAVPGVAAASTAPSSGPTLAPDARPPIEIYYLGLLNCSRSGGYVASDGHCIGYGTGRFSKPVPLIKMHYGITYNVSRPYAKVLAVRNLCDHFIGGDPGDRLRKAGYGSYRWGENIGCRWGTTDVYEAVLWSHRAFQAEKAANGGHWRNIKNPYYKYVGIGVYRYGSRIRLVTDFYAPLGGRRAL